MVFNKAGMINTQYIDNADFSNIPEYVFRYERDSLNQWQSVEGHRMDEVIGAGGIYLRLNDYANYIEKLRNKSLLTKESHELIFKPISMNMELHLEDLKILLDKESSYAMG